jgi:rubredoxin
MAGRLKKGLSRPSAGRSAVPDTINHSIRLSDCDNVMEHKTWMCLICGWIYDEAEGDPEHGIAPGTKWEDVPMNWTCPECAARKEDFEMVAI